MVFAPTTRVLDAALAERMRTDAEFRGVTQSPDRIAIAGNSGDATGAMNPYERAKVHIAYGYGLSGAGVTIGIVDSGFNLVNGKAAHNEFDGAGKLTELTSAPVVSSDDHGAHVSGLALAQRDGRVMQGIAYNAKLVLGETNTSPAGFKAIFDEFRARGALISSNSYGAPILGTEASPWKPVQTTKDGLEVTAKNAIAYRDSAGISSAQLLADLQGGTAAGWTDAIASFKAYQAAGGVIVFANSNYGANDIANGGKGLDNVDLLTGLPLVFSELQGGWIAVTNGTSVGLAVQANGQGYVDKATKKEGNIFLVSAQCGLAANFCLTMDGTALWSASNKGVDSYTVQTGTSQATPEVAGMLALLREAFPTASAADLAARLLFTADNSFFTTNTTVSTITTASYTNANGTITHKVSDIWGHGFPNLQNALVPVGTTSTITAAGRSLSPASITGTVQLGAAFGTGQSALSSAHYLFNDQLNGVFSGTIAGNVATSGDDRLLTTFGDRLLDQNIATVASGTGTTLTFGQAVVPDDSGRQVRLGSVFLMSQEVGRNASLAIGSGLNIDNTLGFSPRHASVRTASLTDRAMGIPLLSIGSRAQNWISTGYHSGILRSTVAMFSSANPASQRPLSSLVTSGRTDGVVADVVLGKPGRLQINTSIGQFNERDSFLGSRASTAFFGASASSDFVRVGLLAPFGSHFALQANYVTATSKISAAADGLFAGFSRQRSESAALSLIADNWVTKGSRLTIGVAQPLRLATGAATLNLPQRILLNGPGDYQYLYQANGINLAPSGRELDYMVDYTQPLWRNGSFNLAGMAITEPGHNAAAGIGYAGMATVRVRF